MSQPGSAVEWRVFILMQCDPQTLSHSHSLTLGQPTVWGLFWADVLSGSVAQVSTASEAQRWPSLPLACPCPGLFPPTPSRVVNLVVCQTKRAPLPFFFSAWRCWSGNRLSSVGPHYAERFPSGLKAWVTLGRLPSHQERLSQRRCLLPHSALLFLHHFPSSPWFTL